MPAAFQSAAHTQVAGVTSIVVARPTGTGSGDLLVGFHFMDPDTAATAMTAASGFTQAGTTQSIASDGSGKVWTKPAGGSEPSTYTFGAGSGSDTIIILGRFDGHDPLSPVGVVPTWGGSATSASAHVAPSVTPPQPNGLLVCAWYAENASSGTNSYTAPGTMVERDEFTLGNDFVHIMVATQLLTSTAATGTRTATFTGSRPWLAMSMVINSATDRAPTFVSQYSSYH